MRNGSASLAVPLVIRRLGRATPSGGTRALRGDVALLSAGTLCSGLFAYAFNVVAARALGPDGFAAVGALWAVVFIVAVLLFRPLEQTLSRAMADHIARDADPHRAIRATGLLGAGLALAAALLCVAAWNPLTDALFGGHASLTVALVASLVGYAVSYYVRGLLSGAGRLGAYGVLLLADGGIRLALALPLLLIASPTVAGVAIAAAAIGGALVPLASWRRLHRPAGGRPSSFDLRAAWRFALPAGVIAGSEQVLLSGGPLLVLLAGGPGAEVAAGLLFAAMLLVRAPVFLFQGLAASLLPRLTALQARGDDAGARRATTRTALVLMGFAVVLAAGALLVGPAAMVLVYGDAFAASAADLALLSVGVGCFLAAGTFNQALLARERAGAGAACWGSTVVLFLVLAVSVGGSDFHRVSVAFAAASACVAALLVVAVRRCRA